MATASRPKMPAQASAGLMPGANSLSVTKTSVMIQQCFSCYRLAIQIALAFITAQLGQQVFCCPDFNTLGQYLELQAMAKLDNCAHNGCILGAALHFLYKTAINLDFIQRQALQVGQ